jgi:hypothetical protein
MAENTFESFMRAMRAAAAAPRTEVHRRIESTVPAMVADQLGRCDARERARLRDDDLALGYVMGAVHGMFMSAGHGSFSNAQLPTFCAVFESVFGDDGLALLARAARRVTTSGTRANLGARAGVMDVHDWDEHGRAWSRLSTVMAIGRRAPQAD